MLIEGLLDAVWSLGKDVYLSFNTQRKKPLSVPVLILIYLGSDPCAVSVLLAVLGVRCQGKLTVTMCWYSPASRTYLIVLSPEPQIVRAVLFFTYLHLRLFSFWRLCSPQNARI